MSNKDLFKEAIADAKAVREAALANAKVALEEALAPKLHSMLSAKLQEMDIDAEDEIKEVDHSSDNYSTSDDWHQKAHERSQADAIGEADELEEDFDLSEILAELGEESLEEKKKKLNKGGYTGSLEDEDEETTLDTATNDTAYSKLASKLAEKKDEEEGEEEGEEEEAPETEEAPEAPEAEEAEKITDLTVDELKSIIHDIISAEIGEMGHEGEEAGEETGNDLNVDLGNEEEMGGEEEINLEELLAELDALHEEEDDNDAMYEAKKKSKHEKSETAKEEKEEHASGKEKKEMKEALETIQILRNELNEVNLLNAKLLYVNKIFKAKNLTESQKLKVIAQFDKAVTAQEAKNIFESMNSAIEKYKKSTIKESLGFASKAAGVAPQKQIVEVNETVSRWQQLAGIK